MVRHDRQSSSAGQPNASGSMNAHKRFFFHKSHFVTTISQNVNEVSIIDLTLRCKEGPKECTSFNGRAVL